MVDCFLLLIAPAAGDELQGIKRGIMELADLVVVNKADGELKAVAGVTASDYGNALRLVRPRSAAWDPRVVQCSALEGTGVPEVWAAVDEFRTALAGARELDARRAEQARDWMWSEISDTLLERLRADGRAAKLAGELEVEVRAGRLPPTAAADRVLRAFLGEGPSRA
jgi:LAO/AO transport system kinase